MKGRIPIGRTERAGTSETLRVELSTMLKHGLVTGSTGSGKTGFLLGLISAVTMLDRGIGAVLLDPKGETAQELRDHFLPALSQRANHIRPEHMLCIEPFGSAVVPLNPLWPMPGIEPAVQANIVVSLFGGMVDGMGQRMRGILSWLTRAVIEMRSGSLLDVHRLLIDEGFRDALAGQLKDPELKEYLAESFEREPQASKDSVRSRIEWLISLPAVRAMLTAQRCVSGRDLIETPLVVVDLGGAPMGFSGASRFIGGLIFSLVSAAIFGREVTANTKPVLLVLDEFPELMRARGVGDDMERLLSQARFKKVGIRSAAQTLAQVRCFVPAAALDVHEHGRAARLQA